MVARVVGAVAHDLNNPLQGILSLVAVTLRECRLDERCQLRLEQIQQGVVRMSRTVECLSAVYENLPRPPDSFPTHQLLDRFAAAFAERDFQTYLMPLEMPDAPVRCYAVEMTRLAGDLLAHHANGKRTVELGAITSSQGVEFRCEAHSDGPSTDWFPLEQTRGVSGIAVLLNEIVRLSQGTVAYRMRDTWLDGVRIVLPTV